MTSLAARQRTAEWMDEPHVDPGELHRSLSFIQRINRFLGYTRATLSHLQQFSHTWTPGQRIDILDIATGSADIPRAILKWADRRQFDVRITAVDRHPGTIAIARQQTPDARIHLMQADALALPFADTSFDYCLTSMFLHHLDDEAVVRVLSEMDRLARRGVIVADLLRHRRALLWIHLFTLFSSPMVKHDAAVSVAQAFTRTEIRHLRDQAGLPYATYHRHFGHRFVLAGQRGI